MLRYVYLGVFALIGVFSRYALGTASARLLPGTFPYGTLFINITGAFAIGAVYALGIERGAMSDDLRIALMVGLLGGYTTFSAYSLEIVRLLEQTRYFQALLYLTVSNLFGALAVVAGLWLVRRH